MRKRFRIEMQRGDQLSAVACFQDVDNGGCELDDVELLTKREAFRLLRELTYYCMQRGYRDRVLYISQAL